MPSAFKLPLLNMKNEKFIDIKKLIATKSPKLAKWIPGFILRYLKRILHEDEINEFLVVNKDVYNAHFCDEVVKYFNIQIEVIGKENIPISGPIVITMNHPLGGMDAIALVSAIQDQRKDIKFIVNDLLMHLDNMKGLFVGVNKHGKNDSSVRQQIMDLFKSDEAVCIFPAGLVSRKSKGIVKDLNWKKTFVTYAEKYNQPIVPIYIEGELSPFFYRLSKLRRFLRIRINLEMLYLSDEMFKQRNKTIRFIVGKPFYTSELPQVSEREQAQIVKEKVYQLAEMNKIQLK
jgi:putative hemolysin